MLPGFPRPATSKFCPKPNSIRSRKYRRRRGVPAQAFAFHHPAHEVGYLISHVATKIAIEHHDHFSRLSTTSSYLRIGSMKAEVTVDSDLIPNLGTCAFFEGMLASRSKLNSKCG